MDAEQARLQDKLENLLAQAAAVATQIQGIEQGNRTPHYDEIELPAHQIGQQLSRKIQTCRALELALEQKTEAACPTCSRRCRVEVKRRTVNSMDGPTEVAESVAHCRHCRRSFFPSAGLAGL